MQILEPDEFQRNSSFIAMSQVEEDQEDYNKVLEDINASIRKSRRQSLQGKENKKMQREESRVTLESVKIDSSSQVVSLKNSPSTATLDSKYLYYLLMLIYSNMF